MQDQALKNRRTYNLHGTPWERNPQKNISFVLKLLTIFVGINPQETSIPFILFVGTNPLETPISKNEYQLEKRHQPLITSVDI